MTDKEVASLQIETAARSIKAMVWRRFRRNTAGMGGATMVCVLALVALLTPVFIPYERAIEQNLSAAFQGPSLAHPLGFDELGREMMARILWGSRPSLAAGLVAVTISTSLGTLLGAISGYYGGRVDSVIMRLMDVMMAIPGLLLALTIVYVLQGGIVSAMVAVGIAGVAGFARLVRSIVLGLREQEFIVAARCIGREPWGIIWRHIMPNTIGLVVVRGTLGVSQAILATSALGFLGLGIQPPLPEWGSMLSGARLYVSSAPFVVAVPGLAIAVTVLAFNLAGDGLRDALDPLTYRE